MARPAVRELLESPLEGVDRLLEVAYQREQSTQEFFRPQHGMLVDSKGTIATADYLFDGLESDGLRIHQTGAIEASGDIFRHKVDIHDLQAVNLAPKLKMRCQ
jgi:hypothetical protein